MLKPIRIWWRYIVRLNPYNNNMPNYLVTDNQTGKQYQLTGNTPPTDQDLHEIFGASDKSAPETSAGGAAARAAATGVVPSLGAWGGFETGAAAGALVPVLGETGISELIGGGIGALIGGMLADKGQRAALKAVAPEQAQQLEDLQATDASQHPVAKFAGDVAGALPVFELNPLQSARGLADIARGKFTTEAAKGAALQTGFGAGMGAAGSLLQGQTPTAQDVAASAAQALLLGSPRFGKGGIPKLPEAVRPGDDWLPKQKTFVVTDNATGKQYHVTGTEAPTEQDMAEIIGHDPAVQTSAPETAAVTAGSPQGPSPVPGSDSTIPAATSPQAGSATPSDATVPAPVSPAEISPIARKAFNELTEAREPVPASLLDQVGVAPEAMATGYALNQAGTHYEFTEPPAKLTPDQEMARANAQAMAELRAQKMAGGIDGSNDTSPQPSPQSGEGEPKLIPVDVSPAEIKAASGGRVESAPDILDAIGDHFPAGVKFDRADHGETVKTARGAAAELMSHSKGEPADQVLKGLHEEGLYPKLQSVDDLAQAMKAAGESRIAQRNGNGDALELARDLKRTQLFEAGALRPRAGAEAMPAHQLFVGDEFTVNGHKVKVTGHALDAETGMPSHVEVEGAFGQRAIPANAVVHLDKGSLTADLSPRFSLDKGNQGGDKSNHEQRTQQDQKETSLLQQRLSEAGIPGRLTGRSPDLVQSGVRGPEANAASRAMRAFERVFNRRIVFVESPTRLPFHGATLPELPRTLFLNLHSSLGPFTALGHEFIESLALTHPDLYQRLHDGLRPLMRNEGDYHARLNEVEQASGQKASDPATARRNLIADFVGDQMIKPGFWRQLENQSPKFFFEVASAMRDFLNHVVDMLRPYRAEKFFTDISKAQKLVAETLHDFAERVQEDASEPGTTPRFSLDEAQGTRQFGEQLQDATDISSALKGEVTNTIYQRRPQEEDAAFAQRIIQTVGGPDQARAVFGDQTNGLPQPVRMAIGMQILKGFDAVGRHADAAAFFDNELAPHTTDVAQGLAMSNAWHAMSKDGKLDWARQKILRAAKDKLDPVRQDIDAAKTELQRQNADGVEHVTADPDVQTTAKDGVIDAVTNSAETHKGIVMELTEPWASVKVILDMARQQVADRANELLKKQPRPIGVTAAEHLSGIMDDLAKRAADVAAGHYRGAEPGVTLSAKLEQRLGISKDAASRLAKALDAEFARQVNAAKNKLPKRVANQVVRDAQKAALKKDGDPNIRQSRSIRDREAEAAVKNLMNAAGNQANLKPAIQEFYQRLTANLRRLLPETPGTVKPKLTDLQLIAEAFQNPEHYEDVWQRLGTEMRAKYGLEGMAEVQNTLGKLTPESLVETQLDRSIRKQLADQKVNVGRLVREHWTKVDATGAELKDKLVKASGMSGEAAKRLADVIQSRFEALTTATKRAALEKLLNPVKKTIGAKPQMVERLVQMSHLGAFDDAKYWSAIRERLDLPEWSSGLRDQLNGMAEKISRIPEDRVEDIQRGQTDFLNAVERAKGISNMELGMAFYMQNVLSGLTTHVRVAIHTSAQIAAAATSEMGLAVTEGRVADIPLIFEALAKGAGRALNQQKDIMRTGMVVGSKLQGVVPLSVLEQIHFGQKGGATFKQGAVTRAILENKAATLLNLWKFNSRLITAQHMLYYAPAEEMKLALLASRQARTEGLSGQAAVDRARLMLGYGAKEVRAAEAQVIREGLAGTRAKMRVAEILQTNLPKEMKVTARDYALRQTFLNDPYGFAGALANVVAQAKQSENAVLSTAARVIVPFTRIAANLFNEGLNYTPVGAARARFAKTELLGQKFADISPEVREDLKRELYAKSALGTMLITGIAFKAAQGLNQVNPSFAVYGAGPNNTEDKKAWQAKGGIPYSIKIGDRYVSYANTPANVMMATLGNYLDGVRDAQLYQRPGAKRLAEDLPMRAAASLVGASKVILEQPFLQSLLEMAHTVGNNNPAVAAHGAVQTVARTASSFVVPNLLRQVDRFYDPTSYDTKSLAGILTSQVPFVRQTGRPSLNALGQPIQSPVFGKFVSSDSTDPLVQTLTAHNMWPATPNRSQTTVNGVPLSDDEFYTFNKTRGDALAKMLSNPNVAGVLDRVVQAKETLAAQAKVATNPVLKAKLTAKAQELQTSVLGIYESAANKLAEAAVIRQRGY